MRWSDAAEGEDDGGVLLVRVPFAELAADAAGESEDRGSPGCPNGESPGVRRELNGRGEPSCLGNVLLSRLSQTGLAQAAHAAGGV